MSFPHERSEKMRPACPSSPNNGRFEPSKQPCDDSFTQQLLSDGHITMIQLHYILKIF